MSDRKVFQIVVPKEQRELIDLVVHISGAKVSPLVRRLLLEWAADKVNMPGVMRGGVCGARPEACQQRPADHFNTANRVFICSTCAERLQQNGGASVVVVANDSHQPAINLDTLRSAIEAELGRQKRTESLSTKSSAELLQVISDASAELLAREGGGRERSFEDIVESFSS